MNQSGIVPDCTFVARPQHEPAVATEESDESDSEHDHVVNLRLKTGALNGGRSLLYSIQ